MRCSPGCRCGRHKPQSEIQACPPGCRCKRHAYQPGRHTPRPPCPPGCTCGRHQVQGHACEDGCTCARHRGNAYTADPRLRSVLSRHRLDRQVFDRLWAEQDGRCYACGLALQWETFTVDHDHRCCAVRGSASCGNCVVGFTCKKCNTGFGMFNDDPDLMLRAARARRERMSRGHD